MQNVRPVFESFYKKAKFIWKIEIRNQTFFSAKTILNSKVLAFKNVINDNK